jgi:hypothetical protein
MANLNGLPSIVSKLTAERTSLVNQLQHVDAALAVLGNSNDTGSYTRPTRTISPAGRKRIAAAQRARWATAKSQAPKPKRTISAAGRRRIAAAQRARWAKMSKSPKPVMTGAPRKQMSLAGRRRIAAAQRARWAKARVIRDGKKAA